MSPEIYLPVYRDGLLEDVLPFWVKNAPDMQAGGFIFNLDREGKVISTDKSVWIHGRFVWLLSTLYTAVEPREEWLSLARHGLDFLEKHAFDTDGRMFFSLTKEGNPLRKRRYVFSEFFAIAAYAAYGKAAGDAVAVQKAVDLFHFTLHQLETPGLLPPKVFPETRNTKGLSIPMITLVTAQILREVCKEPWLEARISQVIAELEKDFLNEEFQAVMEVVGPNGEFLDNLDGRLLNPGHAIEASWFVLHEAKYKGNDPRLLTLGLKMLDWSWKWGWDEEYGGIIYFRDCKNLPPTEYWHDMKFWWPQCEAIIANLLAWQLTGEEKYARQHRMIHDWTYGRFPDPEYGEWLGYLHRDGRVSTTVKGNMWKGPFHIPRMLLYCWKLLEEKN
ncbi:MAG: AGE family epimerase/isomerase [Bacteroidia bacterium]|nr:AGE family epimerase/isomerase [Bacteroidia bacterium]